ncbi:hypothetical protein [Sorangium sp. So ce1151]|uniref:hypothetical protein n=1 Tax=Sorangium sp. So ce1151 TaxID=3133332 RepID=UPI003F5FB97D
MQDSLRQISSPLVAVKPPRPSFCALRTPGAALGVLALAALSGCGSYISDYVPPPDGRARPVYRDGAVVMEIGGSTPACLSGEEGPGGALPSYLDQASGGPAQPAPVRFSGGFWVPIYFGPRIVVEGRGVAPPPPHLHRPGPGVARSPASPSRGVPSRPSGSSGSAPSGGDGAEAASVLLATFAVVALVALPPIAVGLSVGRPEREKDTALALDHVNAFNDLARTPGSPCAVAAPGAQVP